MSTKRKPVAFSTRSLSKVFGNIPISKFSDGGVLNELTYDDTIRIVQYALTDADKAGHEYTFEEACAEMDRDKTLQGRAMDAFANSISGNGPEAGE